MYKKEKKSYYSYHPFVFKCLITIYICYLFEFKYFNYLILIKKKKLLYPEISMVFVGAGL